LSQERRQSKPKNLKKIGEENTLDSFQKNINQVNRCRDTQTTK